MAEQPDIESKAFCFLGKVFKHARLEIYAQLIAHVFWRLILGYILRGTRNLSFVLRRSLLRTFETILILVITLECSNITASKSIRRERKMSQWNSLGSIFRRMGQNQSVHDLIKSYVSVCDELQSHNFV